MSADVAFWIYNAPNMVLAILLYMLLGRYVLSLLFRDQSDLVIWRVFCQVTDPVLKTVRAITPLMVPNGVVLVFSIIWLMILRMVLFILALMFGFAPAVGG